MTRRRLRPHVIVGAIVLAALALLALLPIYWVLLTSLRTRNAALLWPPRLLPAMDELTIAAYARALTETPLLAWLGNSLVITLASVAATLLIAVPAGYALCRSDRPEARAAGAVILISKILPASVVITPLYVMIRGMGLLNHPLAVVVGNLSFAVPFATWMLRAYFAKIPPELEEAARVDGDTRLGALWRVVLPMSMPAMAAVGVYVFVASWNDFLFARTFLSGGDATTVSVGITMFLGELRVEWTMVMAAAVIATLPGVVVFLALQNHLVRGMAGGHH
jgi:multiple sugar transport system permease protein